MSSSDVSAMEKPKRRMPRYLKGILIFLAVNTVITVVVLVWLYNSLLAYEAGTPTAALTRYFTHYANGEMEDVRAGAAFTPDAWNTWEDYDAWLKQQFGQVDPDALSYRTTGHTPEGATIYAVYAGQEKLGEVQLTQTDGGWRVSAPAVFKDPATITAPGHVAVAADGIPLTAENCTVQESLYEGFEELPEGYTQPRQIAYTLPPMLFDPMITATGAGGTECDLIADADTRTIQASPRLSDDTYQAMAARVEQVSKVYANFISEDVPFSSLAAHLLPGTDFYSRMRGYYVGWYLNHESFEFLDLEVFNIISCSETCFTGEISFTYEVNRRGTIHTFPSAYKLAFTLVDGNWMLVDLQVQ